MNIFINRLYSLAEWISKLAYLNVLWLLFTLFGLIVFGMMPSTVSMFTIIRKWLKGDADFPIFRTFSKVYKQEFLKSNIIGGILAVFYVMILIDLFYLNALKNFSIISILLYLFMFAVIMTTLYIFPVFVHYELNTFTVIKNSFLLMLINPFTNIVIILSLAITFYVMKILPALIVFYGASFPALSIMASCYMTFERLAKKKEIKSL
ncbi:YesL family protein [Caldifermentibacillus hisashii]|uniref:YesL family protein n=1 Tax=Caldifermentibacillus hisashii TaxID=996558 RepID=UPI0022B9B046|nr:DUF624 domain-containing protein [Caldifermentibacillus hisashii]MEC5271567.1 DUF624 domain-containing protein [Caldifermentibacillus hisashii]